MDRILLVIDDREERDALASEIGPSGVKIVVASRAEQGLDLYAIEPSDVIVADYDLSGMNGLEFFRRVRTIDPEQVFVLVSDSKNASTAAAAVQEGLFDYLIRPIDREKFLMTLSKALEVKHLRNENIVLKDQLRGRPDRHRIVGSSPAIVKIMEQIKIAAPTNSTVLIEGPSGTGKEVVADEMHFRSLRERGPFVKVNVPAIPETLLESELFGADRGAYTGAVRSRRGYFEQADRGTIFLDEISEMPRYLQAKLLRVIQEREIQRLGSEKTIKVDFRLICATNRNLESMVESGDFREDLYYRLNVVRIRVPALSERREDIPVLARTFLQRFAIENGKHFEGFTEEAQALLLQHEWRGNVRELENAIERAAVLSPGPLISDKNLGLDAAPTGDSLIGRLFAGEITLDDMEAQILQMALERANGNQSKAAKILGLSRRTFQYRITRKYNLNQP